jgi:hypothetical protein
MKKIMIEKIIFICLVICAFSTIAISVYFIQQNQKPPCSPKLICPGIDCGVGSDQCGGICKCPDSMMCNKNTHLCERKPEVFYYNKTGPSVSGSNSGFTYEEAKDISNTLSMPIATFEQILDAYNNGMDMSFCLWGWGNDGSKYWCSNILGTVCDGNTITRNNTGVFSKTRLSKDERCGIFFYGIKPMENSIANCLTIQENKECSVPWFDGDNQWSKYS